MLRELEQINVQNLIMLPIAAWVTESSINLSSTIQKYLKIRVKLIKHAGLILTGDMTRLSLKDTNTIVLQEK